jgi:hypothetical protein
LDGAAAAAEVLTDLGGVETLGFELEQGGVLGRRDEVIASADLDATPVEVTGRGVDVDAVLSGHRAHGHARFVVSDQSVDLPRAQAYLALSWWWGRARLSSRWDALGEQAPDSVPEGRVPTLR